MSVEKMREEFEVAFVAEEVRLLGEGFRGTALYMIEQDTVNVRSAWWAWKASRAALVVELPETHKPGPEDDERWHNIRNNTIAACKRAIEAAGVKCK